MTSALAYLDTSAYVKLPLAEPERDSLLPALEPYAAVSSRLLAVEAVRACRRYGEPYADAARAGLRAVTLSPLDERVLAAAQTLDPATMGTLDALHLATALSVERLAAFMTYDDRRAEAARAAGLAVVAPR